MGELIDCIVTEVELCTAAKAADDDGGAIEPIALFCRLIAASPNADAVTRRCNKAVVCVQFVTDTPKADNESCGMRGEP